MVSEEQMIKLELEKLSLISLGEKRGVFDIGERVDSAMENFKIAYDSQFDTENELHAYSLLYSVNRCKNYLMECAKNEIEGKKSGYQRERNSGA